MLVAAVAPGSVATEQWGLVPGLELVAGESESRQLLSHRVCPLSIPFVSPLLLRFRADVAGLAPSPRTAQGRAFVGNADDQAFDILLSSIQSVRPLTLEFIAPPAEPAGRTSSPPRDDGPLTDVAIE